MQTRCAAVGARQAALQCGKAALASAPLPPLPLCPAAAAVTSERRRFASGRQFNGFPFGGGGFPGSAPPRGDSQKFYDLLAVAKDATEADIKQAYKKQAMQHHPDRGGDEAKFKEISRAYEVLSNQEKREIYDAYGEEGIENMEKGGGGGGAHPGMDPFDLFSQMFGFDAGGRRTQRGKPVTPDSTYELQLSLEELYEGTTRNLIFTRNVLCSTCNGQGGKDRRQCSHCKGAGQQVHFQQMGMFVQQVQSVCAPCGGKGYVIPPANVCPDCKGKCTAKEKKTFTIDVERGFRDGQEFRFKGQADQMPDHNTGDVVVVIREKPHKVFQRIEESLVMSKKLTLAEALCGFQFTTDFLDGENLVIRSASGQVVKPGEMMVVQGKGMPYANGQKTGNLFLVLDVEFPNSLPRESRDKILDVLGGQPISERTPGTAIPDKLSKRQAQELSQRWAQIKNQEQQGRRTGGSDGGCTQQ